MTSIVEHAAALLRQEIEPAVPVGRLYAEIEASLGPQPGGALRLYERLRQAPDRFILLERQEGRWDPPPTSPDADRLREALRRAGIETEPRVMLRAAPPERTGGSGFADPGAADPGTDTRDAAGTMDRLRASLAGLIIETAAEPGLEEELVEALDRAAELRRALGSLARVTESAPGWSEPPIEGSGAGARTGEPPIPA